jgi:hypothetical protein
MIMTTWILAGILIVGVFLYAVTCLKPDGKNKG